MSDWLACLSAADLPAVNASLNAAAGVLLVVGKRLIKRGHEQAHQATMLAAFAVSVVFLTCYLTYHYDLKSRTGASGIPFTGGPPLSYAYYAMLASHIVLAALVPFLALANIVLGFLDRRVAHRRLARWTYPIWLYVSITGVLIYLVLYHIYPAEISADTMTGIGIFPNRTWLPA